MGAAAGAWHTVVWTAAGEVFACGDNSMGQLGHGQARPHLSGLVRVALPPGTSVREVAAGGHHNLLLTKEGALYGWGSNAQGQLGLQTEESPQVGGRSRNNAGAVNCPAYGTSRVRFG